MTLLAPWGLLALLAVPAVLALHLFRRRLERRRVAGLFLFTDDRLVATAGRRRTRLLHSASLWLEVLAALLLALWLADPSFGATAVPQLVAVLDDSASMAATDGSGRSARDRAVDALTARLGAAAAGTRVTLLCTGARPQLLLGPAGAPSEAAAALRRWQPRQPAHDPGAALELAQELAGAGEVVWFTDRAQPAAGPHIAVVATGVPGANAALLQATRWRHAGGERVRAVVAGFGGRAATTLTVRADGRDLARAELALGAEPVVAVLDVKAPAGADLGDLELALGPDALAIDDRVFLLPPAARSAGVAVLLDAATRAALRWDEACGAVDGWHEEADPARAELVVAAAPGRLAAGHHELVVPRTPSGPAAGADPRAAFAAPFATDATDALLVGAPFEGVVWVTAGAPGPGRAGVASGGVPLLLRADEDDGVRYWLDLDPSVGNVVRSPLWPVLVQNLVAAARDVVPGLLTTAIPLGAELRYRRGVDAVELALVDPSGAATPGRGVREATWLPTQPGRHSVRDQDGRELAAAAVQFVDAAESDLAAAATLTQPATAPAQGADGAHTRGPERRVLAVLVLLLVASDWLLLGRRRG